MLIIFDLDDTLIDTSGCLTPTRLKQSLQKMKEAGLFLSEPEKALKQLYHLNQKAPSSEYAIKEFFDINALDPSYLEIGLKEMYEAHSLNDLELNPTPGAVDLLSELSQHHRLALVTIGNSKLQFTKMEKAGIDTRFFSKIFVCEEKNKSPYYKMLLETENISSSQVIVCGDRVSLDLTPAKKLGCITVLFRWGRGLHQEASSDVDLTIIQLNHIKKVIKG